MLPYSTEEGVDRFSVSVLWRAPCGSADSDEDEGPRQERRGLMVDALHTWFTVELERVSGRANAGRCLLNRPETTPYIPSR